MSKQVFFILVLYLFGPSTLNAQTNAEIPGIKSITTFTFSITSEGDTVAKKTIFRDTFDPQGNQLRQDQVDKNGNVKKEQKFRYNSENQLTEEYYYNYASEKGHHYFFSYDSHGNLNERKVLRIDDRDTNTTVDYYRYDAENRLIQEGTFFIPDNIANPLNHQGELKISTIAEKVPLDSSVYEYREDRMEYREYDVFNGLKLEELYIQHFNETGAMTLEELFMEDGTRTRHSTFIYNDSGNLIERTQYKNGVVVTEKFLDYDPKGQVIRDEYRMFRNGKLQRSREEFFDGKGNVLKRTESAIGEDGEMQQRSFIFEYEFDSEGTWVVKRTTLEGKGLKTIVRREIEYFE